jgi:uncharacterized membrane protein
LAILREGPPERDDSRRALSWERLPERHACAATRGILRGMPHLITDLGPDLLAFLSSTLVIGGYYVFLWRRVKKNPSYSIHGVNEIARTLWVEHVMSTAGDNVMAVQTLRNFIMASILMASTASLLILGTLTLSGQAENIAHSWHLLSAAGSYGAQLWIVKVLFLLVNFIVAFFAFVLSIRLCNQVLFMVNVKRHAADPNLAPAAVARRLVRAGDMFAIGMRSFFFAIPLVFWLFGPGFLFAASIALVLALYYLDRGEAGQPA